MAVISQYQVVIAGQIITAALWNGMELNIINNGLLPVGIEDYSTNDAQAQTQTDPYPAAVLSKATDLAGEVARLRYQVAQILGETYWYIDPDVDIATFKTRFDAHTHDATANNGPKLTVSGLADDAVETAKIKNLAVTNAKINDMAGSKITGSVLSSLIIGTTTNDNASAGYIGEYVEGSGTLNNVSTSTYYDITSISLTAGDWDVFATGQSILQGGTATIFAIGIGTASGNNTTGMTESSNLSYSEGPSTTVPRSASAGPLRVKLTGTTTYYLKTRLDNTGSSNTINGYIKARRIR